LIEGDDAAEAVLHRAVVVDVAWRAGGARAAEDRLARRRDFSERGRAERRRHVCVGDDLETRRRSGRDVLGALRDVLHARGGALRDARRVVLRFARGDDLRGALGLRASLAIVGERGRLRGEILRSRAGENDERGGDGSGDAHGRHFALGARGLHLKGAEIPGLDTRARARWPAAMI